MVNLAAAPDEPEKLALQVRMVQQDDPSAVQQRLDFLQILIFKPRTLPTPLGPRKLVNELVNRKGGIR